VYGEGEWTGHIEARAFTKNNVKASHMVEARLNQVNRPIIHISTDRAYDDFQTLEELLSHGIRANIPLFTTTLSHRCQETYRKVVFPVACIIHAQTYKSVLPAYAIYYIFVFKP
jgi:DNA-binding PucR family transcriptional regulator